MSDHSLPLLVLGAGGHAKVLIEIFQLNQQKVIGIITPDLHIEDIFEGLNIIGDDTAIDKYDPTKILLINGLGAIPGNRQRWNLSDVMRKKGFKFDNVIHPNSIIAKDVILAEGVQLMAGSIIQPGCKIGQDSIINTGVKIDHDSSIGFKCHIAPGVTLSGGVHIGNNVHIGTGVQVIQGIQVGDHSVIASGTTVYKDVPSGVMVRQNAKIVMEKIKG